MLSLISAADSREPRSVSPPVCFSLAGSIGENTERTDDASCAFPGPSLNGQPRKVQILKRPSREGQNQTCQPVVKTAESASPSGGRFVCLWTNLKFFLHVAYRHAMLIY